MRQAKLEELKRAYDKEKDHRVVGRMLAVYHVHICGKSAQEVADDLWSVLTRYTNGCDALMRGALMPSGTSLVVEGHQRHRATRLTDT